MGFTHYRIDVDLADEDRARLSELAPMQRQEWAQKRIEEYKNRIHGLRCAYNTYAPIHRTLPPEVLMTIFDNVATPNQYDYSKYFSWPQQTQRLAVLQVCRLWRHLVLRCHVFWATIVGPTNRPGSVTVDRFGLFLELSGAVPIRLSLGDVPFSPGLMQVVAPHANRLTELTVSEISLEQWSDVYSFLKTGLPILRHLHVYLTTSLQDGEPRDLPTLLRDLRPLPLSVTLFPRLQIVNFPLLCLANSPLSDRLRVIRLHGTVRSTEDMGRLKSRTTDWIFLILEPCVSLEELDMDFPIVSSLEPAVSGRILTLPRLCKLYFGNGGTGVADLLQRLVIPPSCLVLLSCGIGPRPMAWRDLIPANPCAFPHLGEVQEVRVLVDICWPFVQGFNGGTQVLSCHALRSTLDDTFTDVSVVLSPFRALTALVVDTGPSMQSSQSRLHHLLASFPQLRRLEYGRRDGRMSVLPLLDPSNEAGHDPALRGESRGCLAPALEHLSVFWRPETGAFFSAEETLEGMGDGTDLLQVLEGSDAPMFCDSLVDMVRNRAELGAQPLKSLSVRISDSSVADAWQCYSSELWQPAALQERLRTCIRALVDDVEVLYVHERKEYV
ncbi:hypothetical protein C8Q76DRAFT_467282 [Earliella scabrosa]|nr:hypothetical protein C8Q76DRAFT_467282 [Earliella scabrosa]